MEQININAKKISSDNVLVKTEKELKSESNEDISIISGKNINVSNKSAIINVNELGDMLVSSKNYTNIIDGKIDIYTLNKKPICIGNYETSGNIHIANSRSDQIVNIGSNNLKSIILAAKNIDLNFIDNLKIGNEKLKLNFNSSGITTLTTKNYIQNTEGSLSFNSTQKLLLGSSGENGEIHIGTNYFEKNMFIGNNNADTIDITSRNIHLNFINSFKISDGKTSISFLSDGSTTLSTKEFNQISDGDFSINTLNNKDIYIGNNLTTGDINGGNSDIHRSINIGNLKYSNIVAKGNKINITSDNFISLSNKLSSITLDDNEIYY